MRISSTTLPTDAAPTSGPASAAPNLTAVMKEYLDRYRTEFDRRLAAGARGFDVGQARSRSMDGLLSALLPATRATLAAVAGKNGWVDCSVAAVGSYGRGALAPGSDLDVRIVVDKSPASADKVAEALLYPLWDAGLAVGHQVIDADGALDLARHDLATATSLLDLRCVAGDRRRVESLVERALSGMFTGELARFVDRLREERQTRHDRFGGSLYLLEPDVKSGAGGLRDLDLARWAARARFRVRELGELVRLGVWVPREADEIHEAQSFLWDVRAQLHSRSGRRSDRLTFDMQEELGVLLAPSLGLPTSDSSALAAEAFMQRYYGHARTVCRLVDRVLDLCDPPRRVTRSSDGAIAPGIKTFDGHATLEQPSQLSKEPELALRLYAAALRRGIAVYPYARDAVGNAIVDPDLAARLRDSREASALFLECLTTAADRARAVAPHAERRAGSILRELHDVGLLLAMVPEFLPVVGRVHHDIYHVYTVDVHSVAAVDRLRALQRGDLAAEYPLACRLAGDVARPLPLYVATLLHDVGKGGGGMGHSERGAEQAPAICARLGLSDDDGREVAWLIREHLALYHVATRRDLDDPATIAAFADKILASTNEAPGSPIDRLQKLYLLTVADVSTTSPTAMTSWKARMLDDLFLATSHHLASKSRGEETADVALQRGRADAIAAYPNGANDSFLIGYLDSMPKSYVVAQTGASIAAHAHVVGRRGDAPSIVDAVPSRHRDAIELCVAAADRPGLLASIAAALAANRLEILTAHIFVRPIGNGYNEAVDLFLVRRAALEGQEAIAPLTAREIERIDGDLRALVTGADPRALVRERRGGGRLREKPSPAVEIGVEIDDRASRRFTVIDVYAKDRPGLLFTIAQAMHTLGLTIARSKIATEGARAADSFYVTEIDGGKVGTPARREEIREAITLAIDRLSREGLAG